MPMNADKNSHPKSPTRFFKLGIYFLAAYVLLVGALGWWWDKEPERFDVRESASSNAASASRQMTTGYISASTFITIAETLIDKRGGYLSNDIFPPGVLMDNIPEWEFGSLTLLRDTARVFRNDFSRSQSQSAENPILAEAEGRFFFDNNSWLFPQTESEYQEGIDLFRNYLSMLGDENETDAQFYSRADNLEKWLATLETRLGSLSLRLSASVGKRQLDTSLSGDSASSQSTSTPADSFVKTPWMELDNIFYETRGYCWASMHMLKAMEIDFADVLDKKAARVSLQQIIRELEGTQAALWSPIVLNGEGLGLLANHSLVMASYVSRANAAIIDLRNLLVKG